MGGSSIVGQSKSGIVSSDRFPSVKPNKLVTDDKSNLSYTHGITTNIGIMEPVTDRVPSTHYLYIPYLLIYLRSIMSTKLLLVYSIIFIL